MLPSARLVILVMAAAPLFLGGALFEPLLGVGALYCAVLLLAMAVDVLLLPRRKHLEIKRIIPNRLSLGAATLIKLEIRYTGSRAARIAVAEVLPGHMEADPGFAAGRFGKGARGVLEYRLAATRRGRYQLNAVDVRILPALGLFHRQFQLHLPAEVKVFPNLVNMKRYELLTRRGQLFEQGLTTMRRSGRGTQFESLRLYTPGDPMSRVDWKATAKRANLVVKNYEPERRQSVIVAIDVGRATAGEFKGMSRLDYLINAALMLGYITLSQGDWFSLVAFSDHVESYLPPVRRAANIDRVARALFELQPKLVESDYGAVCGFLALKNRKRSLICLMTDVLSKDSSAVIIAYMARFARHHLPLAITLANSDIMDVAYEPLARCEDPYSKAAALDVLKAREEALQAMRRQGVSVLDVQPEQLTPALINRYLLIKATRRL